MPYFEDDDGRLNNFAQEPKMYAAEPMDASQKQKVTIIAAIGGLVVVGLIAIAAVVS